MKKSSFIFLISFILIFNKPSFAWSLFGPKDFDECVLQNMKGVTSDTAAQSIKLSCYSQFPQKEPEKCKTEWLQPSEFSKLPGEGRITNIGKPYFSANIYNGTGKTLQEISVYIGGDNIKPPQEYKLYMSYPISPQASGDPGVSIQAFPGKNWNWNISSVKVCK